MITIVFTEGTDVYFANQQVNQRLTAAAASLPPGYGPPELGPMTTALGEILQFEVRGQSRSPMELRTLLDWEIAPKLRQVDGVTEINVMGGFYKTFEVKPDPDALTAQGLTLEEVFRRIEAANANAGGGYVIHHDEQRFIRGQALLTGVDDLRNIVIRRSENGSPLLLSDVAGVSIEAMPRQGAVSRDGRGEAVTGMVMMRIGENSRDVVGRVKERIEEVRPTLPPGVTMDVIYDREALINRTLRTVIKQSAGGRRTGRNRLVGHPGQPACGNHRGARHSAIDVVRHQHDVGAGYLGEPDELGRNRLWLDCRFIRDHGRKLCAPIVAIDRW